MKLLIGTLVVVVVWIVAYFAARDSKHISQNSDFYSDTHFNIKHRPLLDKFIENGASEKEAYQIILADQDAELLNKRRLVIFWFILTMLCASGFLSGIL